MNGKLDEFQVFVGPVEEKNTVLKRTGPSLVKILAELQGFPIIINASDTDDTKDNC
jgi:hypothetical protein